MSMHLLLIDDDKRLISMVGEYLQSAGFNITTAFSLAGARDAMRTAQFDAVVLDLMLPDGDGLDLCREIRAVCRC